MKVKFKNGKELVCLNPMEQKVFKSNAAAGWICTLTVSGEINAEAMDGLLTEDNISEMQFLTDEGERLLTLNDYNAVASVIVRHSESGSKADIQLTRPSAKPAE